MRAIARGGGLLEVGQQQERRWLAIGGAARMRGLVVTGHGVQQHIVFHSRNYSVSGAVMRGAITIA